MLKGSEFWGCGVCDDFHFVVIRVPLKMMMMMMLFQYVSEKIGGAKGTELEDDIVDMEKVTHVFTNYNLCKYQRSYVCKL